MSGKRILNLFSYVIGVVAVVAVIADDRKDRFHTFHAWQALFLNIILGVLGALYGGAYLPMKTMTVEAASRASYLLTAIIVPMGVVLLAVVALGILAYMGRRFTIPGAGHLAKMITRQHNR